MFERYERPAWVRRLSAMAPAVGGAAALVPLDAEAMIEDTARSTGLDDFGDFGDGGWRERFAALVEDIGSADMHLVGRLMTKQELARSLRTRLLLASAVDADPGIRDERVRAPVIITGPARSGTTILFELLALDPELRAPAAWEGLHPVALPEATGADRLRIAECEQELWADVQPEFAAIHELRSDLPVECVTLAMPSFAGTHWAMIMSLAKYAPDLVADYAYHRHLLQTLQRGGDSAQWLLKTPGHLMSLGLLFESYPDAWIVQTHRDPLKTMPSTISATAMVRWLRTDAVDVEGTAQAITLGFSAALLGVIEQRDCGAVPDRFVDVHFQRLMADPVAEIGQAYAKMGRELSPAHAEAIRHYLADKPKGKFGTHQYSAEEWGIDPGALRDQMRPYTDHYGVALEC